MWSSPRTVVLIALAAIPGAPLPQSTPEGAGQVWVERADGASEWRTRAQLADLERRPDGALEAVALVFAAPATVGASADLGDEALELDLVGGDRLAGRVDGGEGERLLFELAAGPTLDLPVDALRRGLFPARVPPGALATLVPADDADRLYLRVGERLDRVDGTLEGFAAEGMRFDGIAGRRTYPWAEIAAFYVAAVGSPPTPLAGQKDAVEVDLVGGARLSGRVLGLDALTIELESHGTRLQLPLSAVAEVVTLDGRIMHLGALAPASIEGGRPFGDDLGMVFAPRADAAVHGGPLTTIHGPVARGYGVLAPTRLEWQLDGTWERFACAVAVDASARRLGASGSVRFAVEVDGKRVFESPVLTAADAPLDVPLVDLAGATRLALIAEDGGDGFAGDRANWLRARIVRAQ